VRNGFAGAKGPYQGGGGGGLLIRRSMGEVKFHQDKEKSTKQQKQSKYIEVKESSVGGYRRGKKR